VPQVTARDTETDAFRPGDPVVVRYTKWDGARHWTYAATSLGEDGFGRWVGCPPGTILDKPDRTIESPIHFVVLFPPEGRWTPCFNEDASALTGTAIYTDITNRPEWSRDGDGWTVTMVDLDLDVVQRRDGSVHIDDEDEFAEHQVAMGYPTYVIARARADCAHVFLAMEAGDEPYGSVGRAWLDRYLAGSLHGDSGRPRS
jgi:hypothetical protein